MKRTRSVFSVVCMLILPAFIVPFVAHAQSSAASKVTTELTDSIPLEDLIESVAKKTGKKFIVDPRVRAQVIAYGINVANISYSELLTILEVNNFSAVEVDGLTRIVPAIDARVMSVPTVSGLKRYADSEVVTKIIQPKNVSAVTLLQILRPMIPQHGHLAAIACTNTLIMVDRYSNVQRMSALIESLDKGEPYKGPPCSVEELKK